MSLVPRIDQPCPLGIDEQRRIAGHCGRCEKHVHDLSALDEGARRALLARADGPVCVSYRRSARLAHAAAIAITLVAGTAFAGENCADAPSAPLVPVVAQGPVSPASPTPGAAADSATGEPEELTSLDYVVVGGISDPHEAEWVDDSTLPELPMIAADDALPPSPSAAD